MSNTLKTLTVLAVATLLASCGGGGADSGGISVSNLSTDTIITIGGNASKGILR